MHPAFFRVAAVDCQLYKKRKGHCHYSIVFRIIKLTPPDDGVQSPAEEFLVEEEKGYLYSKAVKHLQIYCDEAQCRKRAGRWR